MSGLFSKNELLSIGLDIIKKSKMQKYRKITDIELFLQAIEKTTIIGGGQSKIKGEKKRSAGITARVVIKGNRSSSFSSSLPISNDSQYKFLESLVQLAKDSHNQTIQLTDPNKKYQQTKLYDSRITTLTIDDLINYTADLASVGFLEFGSRSLVAEISKYVEHVAILNSKNLQKTTTFGYLHARNFTEVVRNGNSRIGYSEAYSKSKNGFDVIKTGSTALSNAILQFGRQKINHKDWYSLKKNTKFMLIWEPQAFADLMAFTLVRSLRSRKSLSSKNPLNNRNNPLTKIKVENDPTLELGFGSRNFDDFGYPLKKQVLLGTDTINFIDDNSNRFRTTNFEKKYRSYQYPPKIFPTNIVLYPTSTIETYRSLIPTCSYGILIRKIVGVPGASANGNFSIGLAEAYYIEKGQWQYPILRGNLTGNFYDLLLNIEAMGTRFEEIIPLYSPYAIILPQILTSGGLKLTVDHT